MPRSTPDGLQTLDRALTILNLFQPDREEWSAAEAAEELGLGLGTVSRFMRGLAARGFLARHGRRYRLGFAAIDLGHRALSSLGLRDQLRAITVRLARESGETSILLEPSETSGQARVVDRAESGASMRIAIDLGLLMPMTAGVGRVLLAAMPESERRLVVGEEIGPRLAAQLAEIHRQGYALSLDEKKDGMWGVSAPIITPGGVVIAAFAVIGPRSRHAPGTERRLISLLVAARAEAEGLLGFSTGNAGDDA